MNKATQELDPVEVALGRRAEQRELDERAPEWDAAVRGELELDDAVERRRAAGDDEDQLERGAAYFRPFVAGEAQDLFDALLGPATDEGSPRGSGGGPGADVDGPAPSEGPSDAPSEARSNVVPLAKPKHDPGTSGFWWIPGGLLIAAAAAIAAWWVWPPNAQVRQLDGAGGIEGPKVAQLEVPVDRNAGPLPVYVLETDGGLQQLRGDPTGESGASESGAGESGTSESGAETEGEASDHRYRRDTSFEWVLRPKDATTGPVGVRGFAFVDGSSAGLPLGSLDELAEVAASGAIRITGRIEQLDLEPGRYTIALAVGRVTELPSQAADVHEPAADAPWQVRRVAIEIED